MGIIKKPEHTSLGETPGLKEIVTHRFNEAEIEAYRLDKAINRHPLSHKPTNIRSKLAYAEIIKQLKPTKKYLLPGELVLFNYLEPKFKEDLEYYDRTPMTLFLGLVRTKNDTIREVGINLHYYPPHARARILQKCFEVFRPYWEKNFNDTKHKPNNMISYKALKHVMRHNLKLAFGIKMYIPVLRGASYVVPGRLLSTAYFTEGHFSKATLQQIFKFWRQF